MGIFSEKRFGFVDFVFVLNLFLQKMFYRVVSNSFDGINLLFRMSPSVYFDIFGFFGTF